MRIVAGRHRGRRIWAPPGHDIRPTSDRVREAVFNILEHRAWIAGNAGGPELRGVRILDAFCGTGALGFEALSRGAGHATFMDDAPDAIAACRHNADTLGETGRAEILRINCLRPARTGQAVDLVFCDPPYFGDLAGRSLTALEAAGWIERGTVCVVQTAAKEAFEAPGRYETVDDRRYGATRIRFLRWAGGNADADGRED